MTTDLLKLSAAVIGDAPDKVIEDRIREHVEDIKQALRDGRDYELPVDGETVIIRARKSA